MSVRVDLAETAIERVPMCSRCDKSETKVSVCIGLAYTTIDRVPRCSRCDKSKRTRRPGLARYRKSSEVF